MDAYRIKKRAQELEKFSAVGAGTSNPN